MPVIVGNRQVVWFSSLVRVVLDELLEVRITLGSINVGSLKRQFQILEYLIVNADHTRKVTVVAVYGHARLKPSHRVTVRNGAIAAVFVLIRNPRSDDVQLADNLVTAATGVCTARITVVVLDIRKVKMGSDAL